MIYKAFILMGGNLGNVPGTFEAAMEQMGQKLGLVSACSSLYLSQAWGMEGGGNFYNQVVCLETILKPSGLMNALLNIEKEKGRVRVPGKMLSRTLDLDILLFDQMVLDSENIQIPHPRMHLRRFALQPLNDIASGVIHPVFQRSIQDLLDACPDPLSVTRIAEAVRCGDVNLQDPEVIP